MRGFTARCYFPTTLNIRRSEACFLVHEDNVLTLNSWFERQTETELHWQIHALQSVGKQERMSFCLAQERNLTYIHFKGVTNSKMAQGKETPTKKMYVGSTLGVRGLGICVGFKRLRRQEPLFSSPKEPTAGAPWEKWFGKPKASREESQQVYTLQIEKKPIMDFNCDCHQSLCLFPQKHSPHREA